MGAHALAALQVLKAQGPHAALTVLCKRLDDLAEPLVEYRVLERMGDFHYHEAHVIGFKVRVTFYMELML